MAQVSLPVIAALIALFVAGDGTAPPARPGAELAWMLASLWVPAVLAFGVGVVLRRRIVDDAALRRRWIFQMRRVLAWTELFLVTVFIYHVLFGDFPAIFESYLRWLPLPNVRRVLAIVPLVLALLTARLATYELQRYADARYRPFLSLQLKLICLPLLPVFIYVVVADLFEFAPLEWRLFAVANPWLSYVFPLLLIGTAYAFAPFFLRFLWRTEPLQDASIDARVRRIAARYGLRFRRISVWFTGGTRIANAAVAGLWPPYRDIFVTDWLLHRLDDDEVEAVLAHELGHIKFGHLWLYLAFSISYFGVYLLLFGWLSQWAPPFLVSSPLGPMLMIVTFFYFYFVLVLGFLSRRLERQADLFAVRTITAPEAFPRALEKLGELHFIPTRLRRFVEWTRTHPSIGRRVEFTRRAIEGDPETLRYEQTLPVSKLLVLSVPVIVMAVFMARDTLFGSEIDSAENRAAMLVEEVDSIRERLDTLPEDAPDAQRLRLRAGDLAGRARDLLEEVLERNPNDRSALYLYGLTNMYSERWGVAAEAFSRLLNRDPTHVGALFALASLYAELGAWDKAATMIERAAQLRPENPQIRELREHIDQERSKALLGERRGD